MSGDPQGRTSGADEVAEREVRRVGRGLAGLGRTGDGEAPARHGLPDRVQVGVRRDGPAVEAPPVHDGGGGRRALQVPALDDGEQLGTVDDEHRVVRVVGYVASAEGFTGQPRVVNGASELLGRIFGEAGRHARSAIGVAELPLGAPVEVELTVELR